MTTPERTNIFIDGYARTSSGLGFWGVVIKNVGRDSTISGKVIGTTTGRMELIAGINALKAIPKEVPITIHTDSLYLVDGITKYLRRWEVNGWKRQGNAVNLNEDIKNVDLWMELSSLVKDRDVEWVWVHGFSRNHVGHPENKVAYDLAMAEELKASSQ